MRSYKFGSLDGVNMYYFINICSKMLSDEMAETYDFDRKKYRWYVGVNVFNRLRDIGGLQTINRTPIRDILGIDVVQSYAFEPNEIRLDTKPQYYYFDTDDSLKRTINSIHGTGAFVTRARHSGNTMTSLKILEKTMNKINFNRLHDISIKNVIFNDPATIVFWNDGTKTVVKAENEKFDPEKGLAMAISKKVLGNKGNYYEIFKKWLPKEDKNDKKIEEEYDITEILTAKQLAEKIGSSVSTILRDCRRGLHPGAVKVDGKWLIPFEGLKKEDSNE